MNDGIAVVEADCAGDDPQWKRGRRYIFLASVSLILVTLALSYRGLGGWCSFSPDGFTYLTIARTIAETGQFPQERLVPPPGYPLIIAPLMLFGDFPIRGLRILFMLCWMTTAVMTYRLHRQELGERLAWVAGLLIAANPVLLMLTTTPLSETVFIALLSVNLVLMHAWWKRPVTQWWAVALGGLLTMTVFMVRSMGIVMLPLMAYCLVRHRTQTLGRRARWATVFAVFTLGPILAWNLRQSAYPASFNYHSIWTTARGAENTSATGLALQLERLTKFGPIRLQSIKEAVLPKDILWRAFRSPLDAPTTWLIGGLFIGVALGRLIKYRTPTDAFFLLSFLMLSLWPWDEGVRLMAPMLPILVAYPLWVGRVLWTGRAARSTRGPALASMLVLMLLIQAGGMAEAQSRIPIDREKAVRRISSMAALAQWHSSNAPEGAKWLGVTPKGHNDKLLLMGSAYLSRRPLSNVSLTPEEDYDLTFSGENYALVHEAVYAERGDRWVFLPRQTVGQFIVLTNSYSIGLKPEEEK